MKLYCSTVSVTSRAVMSFIQHAGIEGIEEVHVDLMTGEQYGDAFSAVNPNHLVPVLEEDDGWRLSESSAILKYLAQKTGSDLYPSGGRAQARVNERMDWLLTQFYREFGYHYAYPQLFDHHKRPGDANDATVAWGAKKAADAMAVLEGYLGETTHIAGDELTIADFLGLGLLSIGDLTRTDLSKYPKVEAWFAKLKAMPAWRAVCGDHEGFAAHLESQGATFAQLP